MKRREATTAKFKKVKPQSDEFREGLAEAIDLIDRRGGYVTPEDLDVLARLRALVAKQPR